MRFFDASALVKRYVRQSGSTRVRRLLASGDVAVSRLSEIEVVSALARIAREGGISAAQRDRAVEAFLADLTAWIVVEVTTDTSQRARELLLRHALRSGDAIQLGSALVLRDGTQDVPEFLTADLRLADAAAFEGFSG